MATVRILDGDHARNVMLDAINAGFTALKQDAAAWQEEQAERTAWVVGFTAADVKASAPLRRR